MWRWIVNIFHILGSKQDSITILYHGIKNWIRPINVTQCLVQPSFICFLVNWSCFFFVIQHVKRPHMISLERRVWKEESRLSWEWTAPGHQDMCTTEMQMKHSDSFSEEIILLQVIFIGWKSCAVVVSSLNELSTVWCSQVSNNVINNVQNVLMF